MIRLFDFQCSQCQRIHEALTEPENESNPCPFCGSQARKVIGISTVHASNEDAPWIRSVLEVVDKDSNKPHVREFLNNPTRTNYRKWMAAEGLRPMEPGEKPRKPEPVNEHQLVEKTLREYQKSKAIEITGGTGNGTA